MDAGSRNSGSYTGRGSSLLCRSLYMGHPLAKQRTAPWQKERTDCSWEKGVKGLTVGKRNEGSPIMPRRFASSAPAPTIWSLKEHLALLTWFQSADPHLPLAHDVRPTSKRMSSFLSSTAVHCLNVPVAYMDSADNAASFASILCWAGQLFRHLASTPKERPCFAKWATSADSCRTLVTDFVAAAKWPRTKQ